MGLTCDGGRLACGAGQQILEFHNVPAVARKLNPPGKHDACFLPRTVHFTGGIHIHEMAWGTAADATKTESQHSELPNPELWFVNTQFSCLCTRDPMYSFVPRVAASLRHGALS